MKKTILILASSLLLSISAKSQFDGCAFTTSPDSSCINIGTPGYGRVDTLYKVRGHSPIGDFRKSLFKIYTEVFTVDALKSTINFNTKYALPYVDTTTGILSSIKVSKLQFTKSQITDFPNIGAVDYTNTGTTTSGTVVFYLTSDKTSTGTALYTTINYVAPFVNDATKNFLYSWAYNSSTKALTVTVNVNQTGGVLGLLNILLSTVTTVSNSTNVFVLVKGS